jgi:beta-N-acetylhexosaminidase
MTFAVGTLAFLAACGDDSSSGPEGDTPAGSNSTFDISNMSIREKVGQMFFVRPEALDTSIHWNEYAELPDYKLQHVNETMLAINRDYPFGGVILYAHNIVNEAQLGEFIAEIRELNGNPLLAIDAEGGRVARIANNGNFDVPKYESMAAITESGDPETAIKSIQAGVDVVLCSREFTQVFDAVVKAVEKGEIKESRIDESVKRILELKK